MKFSDLKFKTQSDFFMTIHRACVNFPNGNGLSVVYGDYTYSDDDTYEVAPLHNNDLFTVEAWGNQVKGYLTAEEVEEILNHAENDSYEDYVKFLNTIAS